MLPKFTHSLLIVSFVEVFRGPLKTRKDGHIQYLLINRLKSGRWLLVSFGGGFVCVLRNPESLLLKKYLH